MIPVIMIGPCHILRSGQNPYFRMAEPKSIQHYGIIPVYDQPQSIAYEKAVDSFPFMPESCRIFTSILDVRLMTVSPGLYSSFGID